MCGTFLYYTRAVDYTMLHALNDLATRVNDGTQKTVKALNHFLNHCATHPEATVLYRVSNMILHNHCDAANLVVTGVRSRAARKCFIDIVYTSANNTMFHICILCKYETWVWINVMMEHGCLKICNILYSIFSTWNNTVKCQYETPVLYACSIFLFHQAQQQEEM